MSATRPTFDDLQRDPELGVLTILNLTLTIARFALIATDPPMWLESRTRHSPAATDLRELIVAIDVLARRIDAYTDRLDHPTSDDDLPFVPSRPERDELTVGVPG